jgi:glycosyltransferase involved in cell wall biosynthesis
MRPRRGTPERLRVGWVAADTLGGSMTSFRKIPPPYSMRINNVARWLNRSSEGVRSEVYRRERRYDVVVFFKAMNRRCRDEAERIKAYGGRVVFDANVNYYEVWGEYDIEDTQPTPEQQADAHAMTSMADWVVADSSYLLDVVRKVNPRASWIPDNVDLTRYRGVREHRDGEVLRLVWSGVAKKARPLLSIADALASLGRAELLVVSDGVPSVLSDLTKAVPCRLVRFSDRRYAKLLPRCDVIVSPKRLVNGYELGHSEYKITLGMSAGLPAVASPQQAYVEAIEHRGGGIVCETPAEWADALRLLAGDASLRQELGARARQTVVERYSTPVVARQYEEVLCSLA